MKTRIKRHDKELPLPGYKTHGAAAFDIYAREKYTIPAKGWGVVPSNLTIEIPEGHALLISARSGLAKHHPGLFVANGFGLIDSDFRGDDDEIGVSLYNFSDADIVVERGERIAQGTIIKFVKAEFEEVEKMDNNNRGGFGTTGRN